MVCFIEGLSDNPITNAFHSIGALQKISTLKSHNFLLTSWIFVFWTHICVILLAFKAYMEYAQFHLNQGARLP